MRTLSEPVDPVAWFKRVPNGGTVYVRPPGEGMNAQEKLAGKPSFYTQNPCCAVPLSFENPDCVWHGYRSLMVSLAAHDLPEEVCADALRVETRAMVHALEFVRKTLVGDAQVQAVQGESPVVMMSQFVDGLNHLIAQLER